MSDPVLHVCQSCGAVSDREVFACLICMSCCRGSCTCDTPDQEIADAIGEAITRHVAHVIGQRPRS